MDERIPIALSNTENKLLEERIELKSKQCVDLQIQREENLERIQLIEQHLKRIEDELTSIQVKWIYYLIQWTNIHRLEIVKCLPNGRKHREILSQYLFNRKATDRKNDWQCWYWYRKICCTAKYLFSTENKKEKQID